MSAEYRLSYRNLKFMQSQFAPNIQILGNHSISMKEIHKSIIVVDFAAFLVVHDNFPLTWEICLGVAYACNEKQEDHRHSSSLSNKAYPQ